MTYHATQIADRMARIHHDRLLHEAAEQRRADRAPHSPEQLAATVVRRRRARRTIALTCVGVTIAAGSVTAYALSADDREPRITPVEHSDNLVAGRYLAAV